MNRSRKKVASSTWVERKSQKQSKQMSNRKFLRKDRQCLEKSSFDKLPHSPKELTNEWNLGGDGKRTDFVLPINHDKNYQRIKEKIVL